MEKKIISDYSLYCTEQQTRKALELGAPIRKICFTLEDNWQYETPTAEQMIGWLEGQGIWIHFCKPNQRPTLLSYSVSNISNPCRRVFVGREYESRKEATIAAIDDALKCLAKAKEE